MRRLIVGLIAFLFCLQYAIDASTSISEIYLGSRESDPSSIVENVSTIHGDYTEVEVDLTVASPDSLVLSRFYSSRDTLLTASLGGWRFNPQCFLMMQKDPKAKTFSSAEGKFERTFVYVGNPDGSILTYVGWKNSTNPIKRVLFKIDTEMECTGIANTARGDIGAWTNLKNNELYYNPQDDSFELILCTEGKRFYIKNPNENFYSITHEILPSGNKIFYEFNNKNQLELIKETNASEKKVLAWIKIQYGSSLHLETSDGKIADYEFQQDPSGIQLLTSVTRSDKPNLHYQYQIADDHALLVKKTLPDGRFVHVDYYTDKSNKYKVRSVTTPIGSESTSMIQFIYGQNSTEVNGPGLRKAVYHFDEIMQLVAIEQYLDGSLYRVHKKSWGRKSDAGNLISTSVADAGGNVFYHKYFIYDSMDKGNIIEEREYGDIAGTGAIVLTVDEEGLVANQDGHIKNYSYFSGKTSHGFCQKDAKGTGVKYWYRKGTNLLVKKLVLTKGSLDSEDEDWHSGIKQRFFYVYNDDDALVQVIVDDGSEGDPKDFYSVKERIITNISPKQELPNIGAPEVIEQKYSTSDGKSEFLVKRTVNHFDSQGNISAQEIYDANGELRYTINKQYVHGLLVFETDPMGNETHYSYDANQNLKTESHSDTGVSIEYGYDLRNRLVHTIERDKLGSQFETQITFNASGYKSGERDRFGNETIYSNDSLGRPISITYPEVSNGLHSSIKPTYTYTYDLFDNPVSIADPKGRVLTKTYNVKGKPVEINYLDGSQEIFRYDSGGNLHRHYCRNGIREDFEYDYIGRPIEVAYYPKGSNGSSYSFKETSCNYGAFHKNYETDAQAKNTSYTYDAGGRLASIKKENQKVDFSYDSLGRTQSVKKWKSAKDFTLEVKEYDLLDRIVEERTEDSVSRTLLRKRFVYNNAGELAQVIGYPQNQESILMQYEYDGFGRVSKATNAIGSSTQIIYDDTYINDWGQKGSKRTVIDQMGNLTEEIFDNNDHLIQVCKKDKSGKLICCTDTSYDYAGNKMLEKAVILSADEKSGNFEVEYSYNKGNQLETITVRKGSPEERVTHFEYNSYGELTNKFYPGAQTPIAYQYTNCGDLQMVSYKEDDEDIEYRLYYSNNKNLTSMNHDKLTLSYAYDENELPTSETVKDEFGSYQVSRIYDGEGKVKTLELPDGSYVKYSYEGPFVKSISRFSKNNKALYTYTIASRDQMGNILEEVLPGYLGARTQNWDKAGRRVGITTDFFQDKVTEYDPLDNIKKREISFEEKQVVVEYDYNSLLQLISEKGNIDHNYSYDSIDNRLKKDLSLYKVNALNELIEGEGRSYTFHPNGCVATKVINEKTWTYQSNPLNQIVSIKDPDEGMVTFTYDLTGKRFSKRIDTKGKKRILRFFYIDDTEIGCMDEKGVIVELKIPSNPNNPESPAIAIEVKKETYIPVYDLQGNIACLLDHSRRRVIESYRYSVYGEEEIINEKGMSVFDSSVGNPWRFRGKRVDKDVGLIYFGCRYYDPKIGRWISPDPMGTIDGPNLYSFVRNNPMKYVDNFGFNSKIDENCGCTQHGHPGWHNAPPDCICICGRDGASGGAAGSYLSKRGSDIKSALGGISHGAVDFLVGSLHDLQTAAVYMGSSELEMSHQERELLIEAVEQSQMRQMAAVGSHVMEMLVIDESDVVYQTFRSKTILGLEVASLVAGGYGIVKGVMASNKLARMPMQISKIVNNAGKPSFPKIDRAVNAIENFLGGEGKIVTNADGDMLLMRGNKKIRFDVKAPHGDKPHFHLEQRVPSGKWTDVGSEHRYYFTEE